MFRLLQSILGLASVVFLYQPIVPLPLPSPLYQDQLRIGLKLLVYAYGLMSTRLTQALTIGIMLYLAGFVPPLAFIEEFVREVQESNPNVTSATWDAAFFGGLLSILILIVPSGGGGAVKTNKNEKKLKVPRSTIAEEGEENDPALFSLSSKKSKSSERRSVSPTNKPETPLQRARREAREAHQMAVEKHISTRKK